MPIGNFAVLAVTAITPPLLSHIAVPLEQSFRSEHRCGDQIIYVAIASKQDEITLSEPGRPSDRLELGQWLELTKRLSTFGPLRRYEVVCRGSNPLIVITGRGSDSAGRANSVSVSSKGGVVTGFVDGPAN